MITRDALYSVIENLVATAGQSSALYEAESFRNLRTSVDEARKVVRVECLDGQFTLTTDPMRKELNVRATIQCWVLPDSSDLPDLDAATDESFEMAREIFEELASNPGLDGGVCDVSFEIFETSEASLGAILRGVTYLDGVINQAS